MAESGEWTRKGATLNDVTAKSEYGISEDFIIQGIQSGRLEYREGSVWGNTYLRLLRSQLEAYIASELGDDHLTRTKCQAELSRIKKEIAFLNKKLKALQDRRQELEASLGK